MFCARCGRQIGEEGQFCPFCGQKVGAPVKPAAPGSVPADEKRSAGGVKQPKKSNKKAVFGVIVALAVIAAVLVGVRLIGANRTEVSQSEESTDRTWEESGDESAADKKNDREDTAKEAEEDSAGDMEFEENEEEESDTASEETVEEEILEVLNVYQSYVDKNMGDEIAGYQLAYLDEDDIPELIVVGDYEAVGQLIITYHDGELSEEYISRLGGLSYVEKQNFYCNSNGHMGFYYDEFYKLVDGKQTAIASGQWGDQYDDEGNIIWNENGDYPEQEYSWNGVSCSEEEYYDAIDDFIKASVGDASFTYVDTYGENLYFNMLEAYDALKTKKYSACWPQIVDFDLENDVLTFSADGGARYGWGSDDDIWFSISYPVAPDCIWENRSVGMGENYLPQVGDTEYLEDTSYEEIREWIDSEKSSFEEAVAMYGEEEVSPESPVNIVVVVTDGVVVRVYTLIS